MAESFDWVLGDTEPKPFTIKDGDGVIVNLTGATVAFYMRLRGAHANKVDGSSVTVTGATTGQCAYSWAAADVNTAGTYDARLKVTKSGLVVHTEKFVVNVIEAL